MSEIANWQRSRRADPENTDAAVNALVAQARIEGPSLYLHPLRDLKVWNETAPKIQDLAIHEVTQRLSESFEFLYSRVWSCPNNRECRHCNGGCTPPSKNTVCPECHGEGRVTTTVSHRLATFRHRATDFEFNLLPGEGPRELFRYELGGISPQGHRRTIHNTSSFSRLRVDFFNGLERVHTVTIAPKAKRRTKIGKDNMGATPRAFLLDPRIEPCLMSRTPINPFPQSQELRRRDVATWLHKHGLLYPFGSQWSFAFQGGAETTCYWGDRLLNFPVEAGENFLSQSVTRNSSNGFGLVGIVADVAHITELGTAVLDFGRSDLPFFENTVTDFDQFFPTRKETFRAAARIPGMLDSLP